MPDTLTRYRLHDSLGFHLTITARQQERRLDDLFRPLGLTRTSWCILLAVGNEGKTRPSDIASFLGLDRTAVSRSLRQMEKDGMIARQSGEEDKRTTTVALTAKGRDLLARGTPLAKANAAEIETHLSTGEAATLKRLLEKARGPGPVKLDRI